MSYFLSFYVITNNDIRLVLHNHRLRCSGFFHVGSSRVGTVSADCVGGPAHKSFVGDDFNLHTILTLDP